MDLKEICLEEIALEGLEGITLPTLWLRLENRQPKLGFELTDKLKEYIWSFITQNENLGIYKLSKERFEPQIFDRFSSEDDTKIPLAMAPDELGTVIEVYSTKALTDCEGVRGACSDYQNRVNIQAIVSKLTYTVMSQLYELRQLIIVASQSIREGVLLGQNMSSNTIKNMTDFMYCVLERVARARSQGELQSVLNKINFCDNKNFHVHYVIDKLQALGLVVKKSHVYKRIDKNNRTFFQILILLKRFDREHLPLSVRATQNAIQIIKIHPNCTMNLGELRDMLKLGERHFKKMYRDMIKSGEAVVRDINPEKRAKSISQKLITLIKTDSEPQSTLENDDQDIQAMFTNLSNSEIRPIVLERPLVYQSFAFVKDNGAKGVVQSDVLKFLKGFGSLEARNICKSFDRLNLINVVLVDHGKQRMQSFIPKNLSAQSEKSIEFSDEKKKMQLLLQETNKIVSQNDSFAIEYDTSLIQSSSSQDEKSFMEIEMPETSAGTSMSVADVVVGECFTDDKIDVVSQVSRINYIMQEEYANNHQHIKKWDAHLTTRKIKRHNIILEQLNSEKIIEGYRTIQRCLSLAEEKEGVTTKIDKKTVIRLIDKMHYEGVLQHSVIPITHNDRTENYHFIMALDCPTSLFKSAVDQARFKMLGDEENRVARLEQKKLKEELKEQKKIKKEQEGFFDPRFELTAWSRGDKLTEKFFQPKFRRMRILHTYLWYLTYGHQDLDNWTESSIPELGESKVYKDELSWKRFLPPAPVYMLNDLPWLQLGDVAMILPLSIFCQFYRIIHKHDELEPWLADEERRHILIRQLPQDIRSALFYQRRYMFSLMACIEQLTFIGLVTMRRGRCGGNVNMPKENMMIYVHKNASILDTRSSAKQHIKVEDKPYDRIPFLFTDFENVEAYWYKLQDVCVQTRLGNAEFQDPDYDATKHYSTVELKKYISSVHESQAEPKDDGSVPGDQLGAGGIDSSMYSYLYRNWRSKPYVKRQDFRIDLNKVDAPLRLPKLRARNLTLKPAAKRKNGIELNQEIMHMITDSGGDETAHSITSSPLVTNLANKRTPGKGKRENSARRKSDTGKKTNVTNVDNTVAEKRKKTVEKRRNSAEKKKIDLLEPQIVMVNNVGRNERVKGGKGVKRKKPDEPVVMEIPKKARKKEIIRRNRKPNTLKQGKQKLKYVDKNDLDALKKRNGRIRVHFSQAEDALYLLCHVATSLITQLYWKKSHRPRKQLIPWSIVRDIAQNALHESYDKTSYSVGRRTLTLMKNPETRICHDISVADTKADKEFLKRALPSDFNLDYDICKLPEVYKKLVENLQQRFRKKPGLFDEELPETVNELTQLYSPKTILRKIGQVVKKRSLFRDEITNLDDIKRAVAENMTHIALSMGDAEFSVYQAYRAFEAFPDKILSEIFVLMQVSGIVCAKTTMVRRLPFGIRSHRLANAHSQSLRAFVPHKTVDEIASAIGTTSDLSVDIDVPAGQIFLLSYFLTKGDINLTIDIPDQIILPDSNTQLFENQFSAMLEKYKDELMKEVNLDELKTQDGKNIVPPNSLMAAAACVLRETLEDESKDDKETTSESETNPTEPGNSRLKIAEILKLYMRHPSYTNWLMLINPQRSSELSGSKFRNYAVNSDSVELSPCRITLNDTQRLLQRYIKSDSDGPDIINSYLDSTKINMELSTVSYENYLSSPATMAQSFLASAVFNVIDSAGEIGLTVNEICDYLKFDNETASESLRFLAENALVFPVGITERKYVSYNNGKLWTAKGFDYCGEETNFQKEINYEIELLQHAKSEYKESTDSGDTVKDTMDLAPQATQSVMNRYKEVQFICRPWHTISGGISYKSARELLLSVYLKILSSPGITKSKLLASYTFQPICILDLLDILRQTGCVKEYILETPGAKRLFGKTLPRRKVIYYETTQDGVITTAQWNNAISKIAGQMRPVSPAPE